jgi:hypothetical protein
MSECSALTQETRQQQIIGQSEKKKLSGETHLKPMFFSNASECGEINYSIAKFQR